MKRKIIIVVFSLLVLGYIAGPKKPQSTPAIAAQTPAVTKSDPGQEYRYWAARKMIIRVGELHDKAIAQCRLVRLLMPNCDEDINKAFRKIFWNVVEASGDEVRFAAFSQQVQQFERGCPILASLERR